SEFPFGTSPSWAPSTDCSGIRRQTLWSPGGVCGCPPAVGARPSNCSSSGYRSSGSTRWFSTPSPTSGPSNWRCGSSRRNGRASPACLPEPGFGKGGQIGDEATVAPGGLRCEGREAPPAGGPHPEGVRTTSAVQRFPMLSVRAGRGTIAVGAAAGYDQRGRAADRKPLSPLPSAVAIQAPGGRLARGSTALRSAIGGPESSIGG